MSPEHLVARAHAWREVEVVYRGRGGYVAFENDLTTEYTSYHFGPGMPLDCLTAEDARRHARIELMEVPPRDLGRGGEDAPCDHGSHESTPGVRPPRPFVAAPHSHAPYPQVTSTAAAPESAAHR